MRKFLCILMTVCLLVLSACDMGATLSETRRTETASENQPEQVSTEPSGAQTTEAPTTQTTHTAATTATEETSQLTTETPQPEQPTHSALYIPNVETDDVLRWFSEVVLNAEFINSGSADVVQKWSWSISYAVLGAPTPEDETVIANMAATLNGISGFPGMYKASDPDSANLKIHFVSDTEMLSILGDNFSGCDGGVTIWWNGNQQIYQGVICVRTDLDQYVRNSVIQEEIYNGLGPVQDTDLRTDSLIYSGYSTPQQMTQVDKLILKLLYHPDIRCGMTAAECESAIRSLYY